MQSEVRIERLERAVRQLTLAVVAATAFGMGCFLTGLGVPAQAPTFQPVAVDNPAGFVVLPGSMNGNRLNGLQVDYTVVQKNP
ncbi:MAG: hypothetical protein HEQ23_05130 [Tepidisphaera sp.]